MFKDLKKGYQVYTLDTSGVPKFFMGTVVNVSEPRFAQSQLGQYQQLQDRVMDLTIEVDGKSMTYVVPENQNVAMANGITLACSVDPIMNHLNAMSVISKDARGNWSVTSGSLRNVKDIMSGRMRCTVRDGLASVTSVTSTMVRNLICVEVGEVVTTEEQTLMTRIISGI